MGSEHNKTDWWEVSLPSRPEDIETLAMALTGRGFDCFQTEDARDFQEYSPYWDFADPALAEHYRDVCRILVYLPQTPEGAARLEDLRALCPGLTAQGKKEEDWAECWKQYYAPLPIGRRLLVQPAWLPLKNPDNRAVFYNDPGAAFGTGLHASTRLCLSLLETLPPKSPGRRVLDIGCGSGILGLCALKLGARDALGLDIDPLGAKVARENARKNGLNSQYTALAGDFLAGVWPVPAETYDLIFSNIVADVIIALAPMVGPYLAPGGDWIVSGIITPRLPEVLDAAARAGFTVRQQASQDGWEAARLTYVSL